MELETTKTYTIKVDEAFFMRNAEEIFTYLKIRKDYL